MFLVTDGKYERQPLRGCRLVGANIANAGIRKITDAPPAVAAQFRIMRAKKGGLV